MSPEVCTLHAQEQKDQLFSSKEVSRNMFIGAQISLHSTTTTTRLTIEKCLFIRFLQSVYLSGSGFTLHRNLVLPAWIGQVLGIDIDHSATDNEFILQLYLDERRFDGRTE